MDYHRLLFMEQQFFLSFLCVIKCFMWPLLRTYITSNPHQVFTERHAAHLVSEAALEVLHSVYAPECKLKHTAATCLCWLSLGKNIIWLKKSLYNFRAFWAVPQLPTHTGLSECVQRLNADSCCKVDWVVRKRQMMCEFSLFVTPSQKGQRYEKKGWQNWILIGKLSKVISYDFWFYVFLLMIHQAWLEAVTFTFYWFLTFEPFIIALL